jgi:ribosomal protein S18 acetylase RimI-like enzyme
VQIVAVDAAEVRPMRSALLRPRQRPDELVYGGDALPGALHAVARDDAGTVIGIVSVSPEPHPTRPAFGDWRIRGMATDPSVRGTGVGAALLAFAMAHARRAGGRRVWCNARTTAVGFYRRFGMRTEGEEFLYGDDLPHYVMSGPLSDEEEKR